MTAEDSSEKTTVLASDETLKKELQQAKELDACLIMVRGPMQGHRYFITQNEMTVGRDATAEISISDSSISRHHAKFMKQNGQVTLTDLGSSNGTMVNAKKVNKDETVTLAKEDMVKLGNTILKFLPAGQYETLFYGNISDAANTDALTKIHNKRFLLEALEAEFKRAKALKHDFSILFFDLDHFKKVNDTHGHDAGDFVLKEFTSLIRGKHIRKNDVFARYGGEEFVVLLGATNAKTAAEIGEAIRTTVASHAFVYEGKRLPITTSVGVAELRADIESAQTLIKLADQALYTSKSGGRNRVTIAS